MSFKSGIKSLEPRTTILYQPLIKRTVFEKVLGETLESTELQEEFLIAMCVRKICRYHFWWFCYLIQLRILWPTDWTEWDLSVFSAHNLAMDSAPVSPAGTASRQYQLTLDSSPAVTNTICHAECNKEQEQLINFIVTELRKAIQI